MRYVLILLGLFVVNVANAMKCENLPSCEELGYSKESVKGCAEDGYVSCPFDETFRKCVEYNCETLGFTESDKRSWCADLIKCRGNEKMTLCQKSCFAMTYQELKDLASSGKCKVVIIRNDITMPFNESLTLHADTIIDGSGHTLTSSANQANYIAINLNNASGLKNLKLRHTQTETQKGFTLLKALNYENAISLKDIDILASFDADTYWTAVIEYGVYNISGQFMLEINLKQTGGQVAGFWSATCGFTDAQASIKGSGDSANINIFDIVKVILAESTFHTDTSGFLFVRSSSMTLKNSEAGLKGKSLFSAPETNSKLDLILEEKASLGLELVTEIGKNKTTITTTDNTSKLIVNDKTYHPTKPATTKLSEIGSSQNWQAE